MSFCTVITCMDGRIQLPVIAYLQQQWGVPYVDLITEPGVNKVLAERTEPEKVESILEKVRISVNAHSSRQFAVVGHFDCAGNPVSREVQEEQIRASVRFLQSKFTVAEVIGLWVGEDFTVKEIP